MANNTRRPYDSEEFVKRPEMKRIIEVVEILAKEQRSAVPGVDTRAFSLADESGMGKTWTLRHLAEDVLPHDESTKPAVGRGLSGISNVHSLYVDLFDWSSNFDVEDAPEKTIKYLIGNISLRVSRWRNTIPTGILQADDLEEVAIADLSRWLEADIRQFAHESVFVLLLDQVHEAPWGLLECLDRFLLGPLAAISRVLPIVAGRGQGYPWTSPEMQLHCESLKLERFTEEQTQDQIRRQVSDIKLKIPLEKIHDLSHGYPRLSYAIALHGEKEGLELEFKTVLEAVTDGTVQLRFVKYLTAICVLRSFDDDRIVSMMGALDEVIARTEATDVRKKLMRYSFAFWPEEDATGWMLDSGMRFTRERLLFLEHPDQYKGLHQAAHDLYKSWYQKYPKTKDMWEPEANYHAEKLADAMMTNFDCSERESNDKQEF